MSLNPIKIPEKHYVGMIKRDHDNLPLGFMTPWGSDASARKRMTTVDAWCLNNSQGTYAKKLEPMTIVNAPMSGFRVTNDIRTTGYGGLDKWRIEDPRGFELEITSGNLAELLQVGVVDCGAILDPCVWARNGAQNVLLSTSTQAYQSAVQATKTANSRANWRDVKIGNQVTLQNSTAGIYLGKFGIVYRKWRNNSSSVTTNIDKVPVTAIYNESEKQVYLIRNPRLVSIDSLDVITASEAELTINQLAADGQIDLRPSGNSEWYESNIVGFYADNKTDFEIKCELTLNEIPDRTQHGRAGKTTIARIGNDYGELYSHFTQTQVKISVIAEGDLEHGRLEYVRDVLTQTRSGRLGDPTWKTVYANISDVDGWYTIHVTFQTPLGNTITGQF